MPRSIEKIIEDLFRTLDDPVVYNSYEESKNKIGLFHVELTGAGSRIENCFFITNVNGQVLNTNYLHYAALGDTLLVFLEAMIDLGLDLNVTTKDQHKLSLIHLAYLLNKFPKIKLVIDKARENQLDLSVADPKGVNITSVLMELSDHTLLPLALKKFPANAAASINHKDIYGQALYDYCFTNSGKYLWALPYLMEAGASFDFNVPYNGKTPLFITMEQGDFPAITALLETHKANIDLPIKISNGASSYNSTFLSWILDSNFTLEQKKSLFEEAVQYEDQNVVRKLINTIDPFGKALIHWAILQPNYGWVLKPLLETKLANVNLPGTVPVDLPLKMMSGEPLSITIQQALSPLQIAVLKNNIDAIEELLKTHQADIDFTHEIRNAQGASYKSTFLCSLLDYQLPLAKKMSLFKEALHAEKNNVPELIGKRDSYGKTIEDWGAENPREYGWALGVMVEEGLLDIQPEILGNLIDQLSLN